MVLTRLARPGGEVKPGDLLAEFDRQQQLKVALEREGEFLNLVEQIKKKQADQVAARAQDETQLEAARNAVETANLEMRKNEVLSRIDAEKNRQNLEEAKARLAQVEETATRKREGERADLRILEIRRDRARQAMHHAKANADKMRVVAPLHGLVVLNAIWKGGNMGEVEEGDQVWPARPSCRSSTPLRCAFAFL